MMDALVDLLSAVAPREHLTTLGYGVSPVLVLLSTTFWLVALHLLKALVYGVCTVLCSTVHDDQARLPATWPVIDKEGRTEEWDMLVCEATNERLHSFLTFRGCPSSTSTPRKDLVICAAREAVRYKGELLDRKCCVYNDENFTKENKKWPFFVPMRHWNGWRGWFAEMNPQLRYWWSGNCAYMIQHGLAGALALYYLLVEHNVVCYSVALYLDIGFNMVDCILMPVSFFLGKDVSVYSGYRDNIFGAHGLFKLNIIHHMGAAGLELLGLAYTITDAHSEFGCELMVALLGTTGLLHFQSILGYFTPLRTSPLPYFLNTLFITVLMVWYRAVYWVYLVKTGVTEILPFGYMHAIGTACVFALFTLFNVDFVRHYIKLTGKTYRLWQAEQAAAVAVAQRAKDKDK